MPAASPDVTQLLVAWRNGDEGALERLAPLVYCELHQIAHARMRAEAPGNTLQTTALVNEAYLRLVDARHVPWQNRAHFFGVCARAMRCVLVDAARARASIKRGGGCVRLSIEDQVAPGPEPNVDLLALDEALTRLAADDPRKARVVELRYFGGLSVEETAEVLGVSAATVTRDWSFAKLWLVRELRPRENGGRAGEARAPRRRKV